MLLGSQYKKLVHLANELINVIFPVAEITTLHVMLEFALSPTTSGIGKFERPEEVRCLPNKCQTRRIWDSNGVKYEPA
jgi:hypothetical protein